MEFRTPGKESVYEQLPFGWSTDFTCPRSRPGMSSGRMISLSIATRRWIGFVALGAWATTAPILASPRMDWTRLPSLPNAEGFAGMYAGVGGGSLIAAGGTQFANGVPWWDGGKKIWSDAIYVLEPNAKLWRVAAEKLPHVLGDGGSVTHRDRLICIGGGDETRGSTRVFALQVVADRVVHTDLPALPEPALKLGAAVMGDTLYIIGGRDDPNSQTATRALRSTRSKRTFAMRPRRAASSSRLIGSSVSESVLPPVRSGGEPCCPAMSPSARSFRCVHEGGWRVALSSNQSRR